MDNALINELLNLSLYAPIELTEDLMDEYNSLNSNTVRSYCPFCNEISIFQITKRAYFSGHETIQYIKDEPEPNVDSAITLVYGRSNRFVCKDVSNVVILSCNLDISHQIALFLQIVNNSIVKVGQYPSFIDLQRDKKGLYKQLPDKDSKEINRAIGLFSHGIGVGSFVYLRRVFENLVIQSYDEMESPKEDREAFLSRRMDDRIDYLKDLLPTVIVTQRRIFSILSKGIHQMEEEECLKHFPIIKESIELMLEEHLSKKLIAERTKDVTQRINTLHKELHE